MTCLRSKRRGEGDARRLPCSQREAGAGDLYPRDPVAIGASNALTLPPGAAAASGTRAGRGVGQTAWAATIRGAPRRRPTRRSPRGIRAQPSPIGSKKPQSVPVPLVRDLAALHFSRRPSWSPPLNSRRVLCYAGRPLVDQCPGGSAAIESGGTGREPAASGRNRPVRAFPRRPLAGTCASERRFVLPTRSLGSARTCGCVRPHRR
jgi:hypothetical protein